jgi:hypothetical protein
MGIGIGTVLQLGTEQKLLLLVVVVVLVGRRAWMMLLNHSRWIVRYKLLLLAFCSLFQLNNSFQHFFWPFWTRTKRGKLNIWVLGGTKT